MCSLTIECVPLTIECVLLLYQGMVRMKLPTDVAAPGEVAGSSDELLDALQAAAERQHALAKARAQEMAPYETSLCDRAIGRTFFHVRPLLKDQMKMWVDYVAFAISLRERQFVAFVCERALIVCAKYSEVWLLYADFLAGVGALEAYSQKSSTQ